MGNDTIFDDYELILLEIGLEQDEVLERLNNPEYPANPEGRSCCWHGYLSSHVKASWLSFGIPERLELMLNAEREARRQRAECANRDSKLSITEPCPVCIKFQSLQSPSSQSDTFKSDSLTTIKVLESAFQNNLKGLLKACNALTMAVSYIDLDQRYRFVNKAYRNTFGVKNSDVIGNDLEWVIGKDIKFQTNHHVQKCLRGDVVTYTQKRVRYDGKLVEFEILAIPHFSEKNEVMGCFGILSEKGLVESGYHSKHDMLTGLGNRYRLYDMIKYYQRYNSEYHQVFLVLFDLVSFRSVNDLLGHSSGDFVLQEVARRIINVVEDAEHVFRLGGDEYAFLYVGKNITCKDAKAIAARLRKLIMQPVYTAGREITLDASFGVSQVNASDHSDPTKVVNAADIAMDYASKSGEICLCYCDEMYQKMASRSELEIELKEALSQGEIIPYFQKIINLDNGLTLGYEALARWIKEDGSMVSPGVFIPVAEQCNVMKKLTYAMLVHAVNKINELNQKSEQLLYVSINVSPNLFNDDYLLKTLKSMVQDQELDPRTLLLEVTEEVCSRDHREMIEMLREIRSMGFKIACDDFGTGYSSLSKLSEMPWDILKIDRSFIVQDRASLMLEPIMVIAKRLEIPVVVEGIEDAAQEELVKGLGCQYAQGFLYSKPVPFESLVGQN